VEGFLRVSLQGACAVVVAAAADETVSLLVYAVEALTRLTGAHEAYPRRKRDGKRQGTLGFLSARGLQIEVLRALGFIGARV